MYQSISREVAVRNTYCKFYRTFLDQGLNQSRTPARYVQYSSRSFRYIVVGARRAYLEEG
jgi:hypothetical protein